MKTQAESQTSGRLFVVSTPIGHVEDVTIRALRVLRDVDWILAEDPATTRSLLRHHRIGTSVTSYHRLNMEDKTPVILTRLKAGRSMALVCDAGTPLLCDPGAYLVGRALRSGVRVVPLPGASAVPAALSVSGFLVDRFVFVGMLPRSGARRRALLRDLRDEPRPQVIFASARDLPAILSAVGTPADERSVLVACDLTRRDERLLYGPARELLAEPLTTEVRGEMTVVVGPIRRKTSRLKRRARRP